MRLIAIKDYDISNYKVPSMFLIFPFCSFKCDKENGTQICQNYSLFVTPSYDVDPATIYNHYYANSPLTHAVVCGGLEPLDSFEELMEFIRYFRIHTEDPIVIYTGYKEEEIPNYIKRLQCYPHILVKFGRFIPNDQPHWDDNLGVNLASSNQYSKWIS